MVAEAVKRGKRIVPTCSALIWNANAEWGRSHPKASATWNVSAPRDRYITTYDTDGRNLSGHQGGREGYLLKDPPFRGTTDSIRKVAARNLHTACRSEQINWRHAMEREGLTTPKSMS